MLVAYPVNDRITTANLQQTAKEKYDEYASGEPSSFPQFEHSMVLSILLYFYCYNYNHVSSCLASLLLLLLVLACCYDLHNTICSAAALLIEASIFSTLLLLASTVTVCRAANC